MEYFSIPKLAANAGCSDNGVRRYIRRFPEFFKPISIEGMQKYSERTSEMVQRINLMYQERQTREEIRKVLYDEFSDLLTQSEESQNDEKSDIIQGFSLSGLKDVMKEVLLDVIKIVSEQKNNIHIKKLEEKIDEQSSTILEIKKQLAEIMLKTKVKKV